MDYTNEFLSALKNWRRIVDSISPIEEIEKAEAFLEKKLKKHTKFFATSIKQFLDEDDENYTLFLNIDQPNTNEGRKHPVLGFMEYSETWSTYLNWKNNDGNWINIRSTYGRIFKLRELFHTISAPHN